MFPQLNEFKYNAETGKNYVVYFLKFWQEGDDYIVKYQIRGENKDLFWYGRISKERALSDLEMTPEEVKSITGEELDKRIQEHLMHVFTAVLKKGLDKGFEEPNTEFVFYKEQFVTRRTWKE